MSDLKIYGVIYKITNIKNNKVYIGQTTQSFGKRYSYSSDIDIEKIYNEIYSMKKKQKVNSS